jgi:iron-sulfur cluster assembly accessory protein
LGDPGWAIDGPAAGSDGSEGRPSAYYSGPSKKNQLFVADCLQRFLTALPSTKAIAAYCLQGRRDWFLVAVLPEPLLNDLRPRHQIDAKSSYSQKDEDHESNQDRDKLRRSFSRRFRGLSDPKRIDEGIGEEKEWFHRSTTSWNSAEIKVSSFAAAGTCIRIVRKASNYYATLIGCGYACRCDTGSIHLNCLEKRQGDSMSTATVNPTAEVVTGTPASTQPVTLTANAIAKVREIMATQDPVPAGLRIGVVGGGCSGFQYSMSFENQAGMMDKVLKFDDLKVFVDATSAMYLVNCTVDYVETLEAAGFKFENAAVKSTCGCGSSFSV